MVDHIFVASSRHARTSMKLFISWFSIIPSKLISFPVLCFVCQDKKSPLELLWYYESLSTKKGGKWTALCRWDRKWTKGRYYDNSAKSPSMFVINWCKLPVCCIMTANELSLFFCLAFPLLIASMHNHSLFFPIHPLSTLLKFLLLPLSYTACSINVKINSTGGIKDLVLMF